MSKLLEAIKSAGESDLEAVEAEIAELEKQLDALKLVQKTLAVKLRGKPERKAPVGRGGRRSAATTSTHRERVHDYLEAQGRAVKPMTIADDCGIPRGSINGVLDHEWFERTPEGIVIARAA